VLQSSVLGIFSTTFLARTLLIPTAQWQLTKRANYFLHDHITIVSFARCMCNVHAPLTSPRIILNIQCHPYTIGGLHARSFTIIILGHYQPCTWHTYHILDTAHLIGTSASPPPSRRYPVTKSRLSLETPQGRLPRYFSPEEWLRRIWNLLHWYLIRTRCTSLVTSSQTQFGPCL
jgi:hypothetical protein